MLTAWDKSKLIIILTCKDDYEFAQMMTVLDDLNDSVLWEVTKKDGEQ